MARKVIRSLTMREISGVDRPAQEHAKVAIMKRVDDQLYTTIEKGDLPDEVVAYLKREFDAEARRRAAESGAALPDGSFPIENAGDLHNAMRAIGRAKDPAKAKAHIRARARALGLTGELSDAFKRNDARSMIAKAAGMLIESVRGIVGGWRADDSGEAQIDKSIEQFADHLTKAVGAGDALDKKGESVMDLAPIKKALGLADTATDADVSAAIIKVAGAEQKALKDQITKLTADLAIAKAAMSEDEKKFHDGLDSDDAKEKFRGMTREQRAERMKKNAELPEYVRKMLVEGEETKKRLAALETERALDGFTKQAKDAGLPDTEGATLQKAYAGEKASIDKLVDTIKRGNAALKEAGLFKELGGAGGAAPATAYDELMAKALELRKAQPALTLQQAFEKVYSDPANSALAKRERTENRPAAA